MSWSKGCVPAEVRRKIQNTLKGRLRPSESIQKQILSMRGHIVSELTRFKIGESAKRAWQNPNTRRKQKGAMRGNKNALGHRLSPASKSKMSKRAVLSILNGTRTPSKNKRGVARWFYSYKNQCRFWTRSKLERRVMRRLETNPGVKRYLVEARAIPYQWEGSVHHYIPDILIHFRDGHCELWEVKPEKEWFRGPRERVKWAAAEEWCRHRRIPTTFRVVGYKDLK